MAKIFRKEMKLGPIYDDGDGGKHHFKRTKEIYKERKKKRN